MENSVIWNLIDKYFENNPQTLVRHHIDSYNDFFKHGIFQIFKEKNPLRIDTRFDPSIKEYRSQCIMYFGGKNADKIYLGKPVIYDKNNSHYMYPNEARLRNMTYGMTIHYDIEIDFITILEDGESPDIIKGGNDFDLDDDNEEKEEKEEEEEKEEKETMSGGGARKGRKKITDLTPTETALFREATEASMINKNTQLETKTLKKMYLGKFPIMVQSNFCILNGLPKEVRYNMGECNNDLGGYFIIDGKEKTVVSQEKFGDNMLYVRQLLKDDMEENESDLEYLYSAIIKSISENVSKPRRTLSVNIVAPSTISGIEYSNKNIVVNIPNVRKPVPLFIVFRALGVLSDKEIISMCVLDIEKYDSLVDLFIPSIHDASTIFTQAAAINYIALLTKGKTTSYAMEVLADYLLPHVGEINFKQKAYYLGYIVFKLLNVYTGVEAPTDRDNFKYKRIELVGSLMYDLFREYYIIQQRQIQKSFEEKIRYSPEIYAKNLKFLIQSNHKEVFQQRSLEKGFKKAFKGNWGSMTHTKRIGIVQDLNRLSFNSMLSHLRKTNLPLDASVKVVGPRVLHNSQWGFLDPIDTPDGGNIGLHKHMSMSTYITQSYSREKLIGWLRLNINMKLLEDCTPIYVSKLTKVFVNGYWAGCIDEPVESVEKMRLFRRNALIPIYTSITFNIKENSIYIYTDGGRVCRPIFYKDVNTKKMSYENVIDKITDKDNNFTWKDLITGFNQKFDKTFNPDNNHLYEFNELYDVKNETNPARLKSYLNNKAIIDYIDPSESEDILIAMNNNQITDISKYTHMEIHDSLILGVMGNLIIFPENNPATRNSFSCVQSKQACSMFHTNHQVRMDKTSVVLDFGQTPLVKSRYLEYINNNENVYGENVIVAVMCYTGYNVEDAVLVNEASLHRGLFRTTYYSTYETHEEKSSSGNDTIETLLTNIEDNVNVMNTKPGYSYNELDSHGIIKQNTIIDDQIPPILIGLTSKNSNNPDIKFDVSKAPKKGQVGIVDKTFITDGDEGTRIAKVRIRETRQPCIGDKVGSRAGQKGTIGLIIPEVNMPYTKEGVRPDIIINPHAIPSRMTIGQFVETLTGKASALYGSFGDCTAFNNKGSKIGVFGKLLSQVGYHSSGNEIMYNGMTGEQIDAEVFMGPNYYMRLKQMVKDKINSRSRGPKTALTKQPVSGRANEGGLRIGEMERDSIISHGTSEFLRESMMERSDNYQMAICNKTGMLAIYNRSKNLFMSPMADGPIQYIGDIENNDMKIIKVTKYGRDFSIVNVPYSLKLLIQELQTMNIQMRIITEDNIDQIENMSFSKNINKLLSLDKQQNIDAKTMESIEKKYINELQPNNENNENNELLQTPEKETPVIDKETSIEESPTYRPGSPTYPPVYSPVSSAYDPNSPAYDPNSPAYDPNSPASVSPQAAPVSPSSQADSDSPAYASVSPDFVQEGGNNKYYQTGDIVHYRGDKLPNRLWNIINIGDQFMTIKTDTMDGLSPDEAVKVVTDIDIYKTDNYLFDSTLNYDKSIQIKENIQNGGKQMNENEHSDPVNSTNPTIHFAPVIINGGDVGQMSNPNMVPDNVPDNNIRVNPDIVETPKEESKSSSDDNIFTNNFLIKKLMQ